jgi:hypothetical protein
MPLNLDSHESACLSPAFGRFDKSKKSNDDPIQQTHAAHCTIRLLCVRHNSCIVLSISDSNYWEESMRVPILFSRSHERFFSEARKFWAIDASLPEPYVPGMDSRARSAFWFLARLRLQRWRTNM